LESAIRIGRYHNPRPQVGAGVAGAPRHLELEELCHRQLLWCCGDSRPPGGRKGSALPMAVEMMVEGEPPPPTPTPDQDFDNCVRLQRRGAPITDDHLSFGRVVAFTNGFNGGMRPQPSTSRQ
jgi:hypothetical protein